MDNEAAVIRAELRELATKKANAELRIRQANKAWSAVEARRAALLTRLAELGE